MTYPWQNFWQWLLKFYNSTVFLFLPPFATPLFKVRAVGGVIWGGPNLASLGNTHMLLNGKFPKGTCLDHNRSSQSSGSCFSSPYKEVSVLPVVQYSPLRVDQFELQHPPPQASGNLTVILALGWRILILSGWDGKCQVFSAE